MKGYGRKLVDPPSHLEEGPRKKLGLRTPRLDMHLNGARHTKISVILTTRSVGSNMPPYSLRHSYVNVRYNNKTIVIRFA